VRRSVGNAGGQVPSRAIHQTARRPDDRGHTAELEVMARRAVALPR
jgi:hypothetical protein